MKKKRRLKKRVKLFFCILFIIFLIILFKYLYIKKLDIEEESAIIDNYYIYGQYLSLEGSLDDIDISYDKIDLVLYNGKFKKYKIVVTKESDTIKFSLDKKINRGIYLDNINKGKYCLFIRIGYLNKDESSDEKKVYDYKYYKLDNKSKYDETVYYTVSQYDKKIVINSNNSYSTLMFNVSNNNDKDIYDIVIDPGHGGVDSGTSNGNYNESDIVMDISKRIAKGLENNGFRVKLTRGINSLDSDEYFEEYNAGGRAVISHEVYAKYVFSIHANSSDSSKVKGVELYTASGINYEFAKLLINDIVDSDLISVSSKSLYKIDDGIYTHNFSEEEIDNALIGYDNKGYKRYNITSDSNYLYMIREIGGIATNAFVDGRNKSYGENKYRNSNVGVEGYLIELGYMVVQEDLNNIINNSESYVKGIAQSISDFYLQK